MATATTDAVIDWSLSEGKGYVMNRSYIESCRLNLQYYLWKEALGFTIHPSITVAPTSTIADIASGTGQWLIDIAHQYPSAQLHGFDYDLSKTPHQRWLPSNITMHHWDMFSSIPEDCINKFDFIHVRLLVVVIPQGNPKPVLEKLLKMLKPGGYLQWDEMDIKNMHVKKVDASVEVPALEQLLKMSWSNGRYDWTLDLPDFMKDVGFADVSMDHFDDKDELVRAFGEQHLLTMGEFGVSLMNMGKEEAGAEFSKIAEECYHESVSTGAAFCIPRIVCVGRKGS